MEFPNAVEVSPRVALGKKLGTETYNTYTCLIVDTFKHNLWKAVAPEANNRETRNLNLEMQKGR